jgi:trehalose utilization protein
MPPASTEGSEPPPMSSRRAFLRSAASAVLLPALARAAQDPSPLRVCTWCEGTAPKAIYPDDIDGAVADALRAVPGVASRSARLAEPDSGLADALLDQIDVLVWWGRLRHDDVSEERARAVAERVRAGRLGLIALHSSFASRPFRLLMGMACEPKAWGEEGRPEHVAIADPAHPIARAVEPFTIPRTTSFAEPFAVPEPESVVLVSSWDGGDRFRSGLTWTIGEGRVAYLRPGDDAFPVLFHPAVRRVLANAVLWAGRRA